MEKLMTEWRDLAWSVYAKRRKNKLGFGRALDERMRVLEPLARLLATDAPLVEVEFLNVQTCAAALRPWDGTWTEVDVIWPERLGQVPRKLEEYRRTAAYLMEEELGRLLQHCDAPTVAEIFRAGTDIVMPRLNAQANGKWNDLFLEFADSEAVNFLFNPYVFLPPIYLAYVAHENTLGLRRLAPLLRQMAQVIVVGSPHGRERDWLVLCS